jgi:hypothetical protein
LNEWNERVERGGGGDLGFVKGLTLDGIWMIMMEEKGRGTNNNEYGKGTHKSTQQQTPKMVMEELLLGNQPKQQHLPPRHFIVQ